jgi:hypothetical protein
VIHPTATWKQGTSRPLAIIYVASQLSDPDVNGPVYWRMKLGKGKHNPQSTPQLFAHWSAPFSQLELRACRCSMSAYIQADGAWWWVTLVYNIHVFQVLFGVQIIYACCFDFFLYYFLSECEVLWFCNGKCWQLPFLATMSTDYSSIDPVLHMMIALERHYKLRISLNMHAVNFERSL